jgi:hypothetical protein
LGPEKNSPTQKNGTKLRQSAPKYIVTWRDALRLGKLKYSLTIRIVHARKNLLDCNRYLIFVV